MAIVCQIIIHRKMTRIDAKLFRGKRKPYLTWEANVIFEHYCSIIISKCKRNVIRISVCGQG